MMKHKRKFEIGQEIYNNLIDKQTYTKNFDEWILNFDYKEKIS